MGLLWSPEDARIADSVLISITRIPETGWLKQQTFISRGSGVSAAQDGRAGRFRVCWEPASLFVLGCLLSVSLYCGRDRRTLWDFFDKDTHLIHEGSTSEGPHLPRPSHWRLRFQPMNCVCVVCAQLCLTICDAMDYIALQAPLFMGFPQARISGWVVISFSRGPFWPRDRTHISCIDRQILYHGANWEALWILRGTQTQQTVIPGSCGQDIFQEGLKNL